MSRSTIPVFVDQLSHAARVSADAFRQCREVIIQLENARLVAETTIRHEQEQQRAFLDGWRDWSTADPGVALFQACVQTGAFGFAPMMHVLEVGCCESDWMTLALHADPTLQVIGLDWRAMPGVGVRLKADVRTPTLFPADTFDWVVSLSAIEHIGLGHYDADPVDTCGDAVAMQNIWTWLKPGGQLYLDVPYRPEGFVVVDDSYRAYDAKALQQRLLGGYDVQQRWYTAGPTDVTLTAEPQDTPSGQPFVNVAIWAKKAQEAAS